MSGDARILIVDDVSQNLRLLEAVLAPRGYDVISATDGDGALELVASAKPDLVLLDVVMPQPDGYTVCRRLRERVETAVLPVIMVTASPGEKTKAIQAGADDLIAKPFSQEELLAGVRSLLRIKRLLGTRTRSASATEFAIALKLRSAASERWRRARSGLERMPLAGSGQCAGPSQLDSSGHANRQDEAELRPVRREDSRH
jgi:DNA-binding response OmpR family regulator